MDNQSITITDNRTNQNYTLPISHGTIRAMDLRQIKTGPDDFGLMTYDPAFMNTASCQSAITYLDGDRGILRYRGYPIEQLAENCTFLEVAYLLSSANCPRPSELDAWNAKSCATSMIHENVKKFMDGFHHDAHPMGILIVHGRGACPPSTPRPNISPSPALPARADRPPDRQDADPGRLRITATAWGCPYVYPRTGTRLHQELHEHAVEADRAALCANPVHCARPGSPLHPARRPRAELQHQHHARGGQFHGRPLCHHRRRHRRPLRSAARRRQRGSAAHARRDRQRGATSPASSRWSRKASAS